LLHEVAALAAWHEHEHRVGFGIPHTLQGWCKIRIGQRYLSLFDDIELDRIGELLRSSAQ
jgi:hypothetical protein